MCESNEMYPEVFNKDGSKKHSYKCQMAFGRKDKNCHRCVEMMNGAPSRSGWQKRYYSDKKIEEESILSAIRSHDCVKSHCGPVCTAFEC